MTAAKKIIAIITARSGSKGLPDKNIRNLGGKPLLAWPIDAAKKVAAIDRILLSSDSEEYGQIAKNYGAEFPRMRPSALAQDSSSSVDVLLDILDNDVHDEEIGLLLEPTSPFTTAKLISNAIDSLIQHWEKFDFVVGVEKANIYHPFFSFQMDSDQTLVKQQETDLVRRQALPDIFFLNGALYLFKVSSFKREKSFVGTRTMGLESEEWQNIEIDSEIDFYKAEGILNRLGKMIHG